LFLSFAIGMSTSCFGLWRGRCAFLFHTTLLDFFPGESLAFSRTRRCFNAALMRGSFFLHALFKRLDPAKQPNDRLVVVITNSGQLCAEVVQLEFAADHAFTRLPAFDPGCEPVWAVRGCAMARVARRNPAIDEYAPELNVPDRVQFERSRRRRQVHTSAFVSRERTSTLISVTDQADQKVIPRANYCSARIDGNPTDDRLAMAQGRCRRFGSGFNMNRCAGGGRRVLDERLQVFAGGSNLGLARDICQHLDLPLGKAVVSCFRDGESRIRVEQNVRGADVFIVQSTCSPVNHNLVELLVMIDAFRRASADRITAVIPYFGYARQEKKTAGREPITAKLVANLIATAGAARVLTIDLHAPAIEGFFDIPVDHLRAEPILASYFKALELRNVVVVSPDAGGVARANHFRDRIAASLAIIAKQRPQPDVVEVLEMVGNVRGKAAVIIDDMVSTGGTLVEAAEMLLTRGASQVYACATHAMLSNDAADRIVHSAVKQLIVVDTIPVPMEKRNDTIKVLSVAPLLAEAIRRIHNNVSVSALLN
jgi:ribose-phosphate pyrophosphokinase